MTCLSTRLFYHSVISSMFPIFFLSGCIPIPYSTGESWEFKRNIDEKSVFSLAIGKTSKKDVLLSLGQPDVVTNNEKTFTYISDTSTGEVKLGAAILFTFPVVLMATNPKDREAKYKEVSRLTIWFDDRGVVRYVKLERIDQPPISGGFGE